jgi:hypothetical protein
MQESQVGIRSTYISQNPFPTPKLTFQLDISTTPGVP